MRVLLRLFLFAGLLLLGGVLNGQDTIRGVVTDESGEPLIGASIWIMGTEQGTITDLDGRFTLSLPAGSVMLRVSYTGFASKDFEYHNGIRKDLKDNVFVLVEACIRCYFDVQYLPVGLQVGVNDGFTRLDLEFTPTIVGRGTLYLRTSQRLDGSGLNLSDYAIGLYHLDYNCDFQIDAEIDHWRYTDSNYMANRTGILVGYRGDELFRQRVAVGIGIGRAYSRSIGNDTADAIWWSYRFRLKFDVPFFRIGWFQLTADLAKLPDEISSLGVFSFRRRHVEVFTSLRHFREYREFGVGARYSLPVRWRRLFKRNGKPAM